MELIVDKGFLTSFFQHNSSDRHKHLFDDFIRFIRKLQANFSLITNFSSQEELEVFTLENPLLEIIIEKAKPPIFLEEFNQIIREKPFHEQHPCMKLFLVNCSTKDCNNLEGSYGYSFICGENFNWKWPLFYSDRDDAVMIISNSKNLPDFKKFNHWEKLKVYQHSLNAAVLIDRYLFERPKDQMLLNVKALFSNLIKNNAKAKIAIDITLIAEAPKKPVYTLSEAYSALDLFFKESFPIVNFTLVRYDKQLDYKLKELGYEIHDRRILTNYFQMESGKGFNLVNKTGFVGPSDSKFYFLFNLYGTNILDARHTLEGYAAYTAIATEVYGSNKNRLLLQFQSTKETNNITPATA